MFDLPTEWFIPAGILLAAICLLPFVVFAVACRMNWARDDG